MKNEQISFTYLFRMNFCLKMIHYRIPNISTEISYFKTGKRLTYIFVDFSIFFRNYFNTIEDLFWISTHQFSYITIKLKKYILKLAKKNEIHIKKTYRWKLIVYKILTILSHAFSGWSYVSIYFGIGRTTGIELIFDLAISGKVLSFSLIICSAIRTKVHLNQSDDCFVTKIAFHENELILKSGKWIRNFPYNIFFLKQKNFVERKTPKLINCIWLLCTSKYNI